MGFIDVFQIRLEIRKMIPLQSITFEVKDGIRVIRYLDKLVKAKDKSLGSYGVSNSTTIESITGKVGNDHTYFRLSPVFNSILKPYRSSVTIDGKTSVHRPETLKVHLKLSFPVLVYLLVILVFLSMAYVYTPQFIEHPFVIFFMSIGAIKLIFYLIWDTSKCEEIITRLINEGEKHNDSRFKNRSNSRERF